MFKKADLNLEHEPSFKEATSNSPNLSPYPNQTLKTNFSKTPLQNLKLNIHSYRISLALSEYYFTFNFC